MELESMAKGPHKSCKHMEIINILLNNQLVTEAIEEESKQSLESNDQMSVLHTRTFENTHTHKKSNLKHEFLYYADLYYFGHGYKIV